MARAGWLAIASLWVSALLAQNSSFSIYQASTWPGYLTGQAISIYSRAGFLYVCVDVGGGGWGDLQGRPFDKSLAIFSLSDPVKPIRVRSIDGLDLPSLYFFGNYAYSFNIGLPVYDFSNPTNPVIVPRAGGPLISGGVSGFAAVGNFGYATTYYGPLYVLDLSDPRRPTVIRTLTTGRIEQLMSTPAVLSGRTLCVSVGNDRYGSGGGIWMLDITSPGNPVPVGNYARNPPYGGIAASGSRILGTLTGGFEIINPAAAGILGSYSNSSVLTMRVEENLVYLRGPGNEARVLDITDPAHIVQVGQYTNSTAISSFAKENNYIYTISGREPMAAIEISQPTNIAGPVIFEPAAPVMVKVTVADGRAYLPQSTAGLRIMDVRHPGEPRILGESRDCRQALGCTVTNGLAYVADGTDGLVILDVHDPANIVRIGSIGSDTGRSATHVTLSSGLAYVRTRGFDIIDVSNPTRPRRTGQWTNDAYSTVYSSLAVAGTYAYFPSSQGLHIVDVSDSSNPQLRATFATNFFESPQSVSVIGNIAYLLAGELWVLDISNPLNPLVISRYRDDGDYTLKQVMASGSYAIATGWKGNNCELAAINILDPRHLFTVARYTGLADGISLAIEGHYAWVCNRDGGLSAFALNPPGPPAPASLLTTHSGSSLQIEVRGQPMRQHTVQRAACLGTFGEWQNVVTNRPADGIFAIDVPFEPGQDHYYRSVSE